MSGTERLRMHSRPELPLSAFRDIDEGRDHDRWPWWKVGLMWFAVPAAVWLTLGGLLVAGEGDGGRRTLLAVDSSHTGPVPANPVGRFSNTLRPGPAQE
ncbi:MAG: hypothetical protein H7840_14520 [Alphaproteobacteria bacterium]